MQKFITNSMWNTIKQQIPWSTTTAPTTTISTPSVAVVDPTLKILQDKIMDKVTTNGDVINSMVNDEINEWHFHNPGHTEINTPTLLVHGYAASSMAFHLTFEQLSDNIKDLYAIDLPGNGLSTAPSLQAPSLHTPKVQSNKSNSTFTLGSTMDATKDKEILRNYYEAYYIERIDRWREENHIKKFNIIGHSFGGYISFKYAITHPEAINDLCLISPLGMERNITSLNNKLTPENEYPLDLENPNSMFYSRTFNVPNFLWQNQLNVLRWLGPMGGKLAKRYITFAYTKVPGTEYQDYLYRIFYDGKKFPKVTINNFTNMFAKNLLARDPILDNLEKVKAKKVMLMYGDHDWMDKYAGYEMVQSLIKSGKYIPKKEVDYIEVPEAGHNLFLDNPKFFSSSIIKFLSN